MQRIVNWVLGAMLALVPMAVQAQSYDNPKAVVTAIYEPLQRNEKVADFSAFYSARLGALFGDYAQKVGAGVGDPAAEQAASTQFNPFVDSETPLLFDLIISEPVVINDTALVTVSYHNYDHPSLLSVALIKEGEGWKVDDVASLGKGEHWLLSWLLQYDVFGS